MSQDNAVAYLLTRQHPTAIILFKNGATDTNFTTGEITVTKTEVSINKAIVTANLNRLLRDAGKANFDVNARAVIVKDSQLGSTVIDLSWKCEIADQIYNILAIEHLEEHHVWVLTIKGTNT